MAKIQGTVLCHSATLKKLVKHRVSLQCLLSMNHAKSLGITGKNSRNCLQIHCQYYSSASFLLGILYFRLDSGFPITKPSVWFLHLLYSQKAINSALFSSLLSLFSCLAFQCQKAKGKSSGLCHIQYSSKTTGKTRQICAVDTL